MKLKGFRAWNSYDWELFSNERQGHDEVVNLLKVIFRSKYNLRLDEFDPKEAEIAVKHSLRRPHYYVAHRPDILIADGDRPQDRIVIEYVNSERSFLRDLRGMLAISMMMMKARGFILAIGHSVFREHAFVGIPKNSKLEIMSMKSLLDLLDKGDLNALVE